MTLPLFEAPYHHDAGKTERAAGDSMVVPGRSLRARIYRWIDEQKTAGATRDELDQVFGTTPNVSQPRLRELEQEGKVFKTKRSRVSRQGRECVVYVTFENQY